MYEEVSEEVVARGKRIWNTVGAVVGETLHVEFDECLAGLTEEARAGDRGEIKAGTPKGQSSQRCMQARRRVCVQARHHLLRCVLFCLVLHLEVMDVVLGYGTCLQRSGETSSMRRLRKKCLFVSVCPRTCKRTRPSGNS